MLRARINAERIREQRKWRRMGHEKAFQIAKSIPYNKNKKKRKKTAKNP